MSGGHDDPGDGVASSTPACRLEMAEVVRRDYCGWVVRCACGWQQRAPAFMLKELGREHLAEKAKSPA